jgi:hypothetical protein
MKRKKMSEIWEYIADTPEEFDEAIKNAVSPNEKEFFKKLRYKILNESAASNDVLMNEKDNEDGLYILRVGTDDIMVGKNISDPNENSVAIEYAGIFLALKQDISHYVGYHITLKDWLRNRDYNGIRYDQNNDYL